MTTTSGCSGLEAERFIRLYNVALLSQTDSRSPCVYIRPLIRGMGVFRAFREY